jgi:hypothetical protein
MRLEHVSTHVCGHVCMYVPNEVCTAKPTQSSSS